MIEGMHLGQERDSHRDVGCKGRQTRYANEDDLENAHGADGCSRTNHGSFAVRGNSETTVCPKHELIILSNSGRKEDCRSVP
mmetsp:Transcript_3206/g.3771  ORF Transcript_3206/g.3771 Transcript_3206/m.3771 type:complete len:82 (+) Transcript_3206:100-345(+)